MTHQVRVNLFSDTSTRPSEEMRKQMAEAEVGDEQLGEDPTVNRLQERVAELLGKEAALFLPSGTMCNEISFAVHCRPGDEIIMDETAHPLNFEGGGPTALTGALIRPLQGERGVFTADQVRAALRPPNRYHPRSRAVSVEQTTNIAGGACWSLDSLRSVSATARDAGLATHLDGARLMNAVVATGTPAHEQVAGFDSAWIDLTKGLGAPVGAVLAGDQSFIDEAWRFKQRLGGAMRQAGIIAAAGIYALDHNVVRLADDHANAKSLARGLAAIPRIVIDPDAAQTNIVIFSLEDGSSVEEFAGRMMTEHGVRFSMISPTSLRAVTHLDVDATGIQLAIDAARAVLSQP